MMDRARRLLGASILGLAAAAVCGCGGGESSEFKTYAPAPDGDATQTVDAAAATSDADTDPFLEPASATTAAAAEPATAAAAATPGEALATESTPDVPAAVSTPEAAADATAVTEVVPASATSSSDNLIASAGGSNLAIAAISEPRETKLLIPEKEFRKEGDALRVSYDDLDLLKVLNMEPVVATAPDLFPQWLKDLEGQRIRIRGFMRPDVPSVDANPMFVLARDTNACCFGPNTKAYDIIPVMMREGTTTSYIELRPFDVIGNFHVNVEMDFADPNKVEFMYYIDDAEVIHR